MKHIIIILAFLIISLQTIASESKILKEELITGKANNNESRLITIAEEEIYDAELIDTLSELLYLSHRFTDRRLEKTFIYACRLLGDSENGRYLDTLHFLSKNILHNKVRSKCENASEKLSKKAKDFTGQQYQFGSLEIEPIKAQIDGYEYDFNALNLYDLNDRENVIKETKSFISVLLNTESEKIRYVLKNISQQQGNVRVELLDTIAEMIYLFLKPGELNYEYTVATWGCATLAQNHSMRYYDITKFAWQRGKTIGRFVESYCGDSWKASRGWGWRKHQGEFNGKYIEGTIKIEPKTNTKILSDDEEQESSDGNSLKEKLNFLKELHEDGLISEDDYNKKKQELLKEL